ncbi:MAG: Gfo/Idh/MocA family oxidoreductase [Acidobacteria bacterium]|nr:Gfo/Idh/MocA family oxidoreductase [Acidobacteriota bacterium]
MARRWRVAILGLGHWYSAYGLARALREYPKAELVAAAWEHKGQLDAFTSTFGVKGYQDYQELLDREQVDIVHIAPPVSAMAEMTIAAARGGKHMVLGKPMAMTMAEADAMVAAVDAAGVSCLPFQGIMRLQGAELKARVDRGDIGELLVMHQTSRWSIAEDWYNSGTPGWFADPRHVPGGALIDEGIYQIDFMTWLAGSPVVEVQARTANLVHREIGVEDWGLATLTFADGRIATLEASWTITAPRVTAPSPKHNSVVRLELVGSRGEIIDQWFREPGRAVLAAGASDWVFERHSRPSYGPSVPFPLNVLVDSLETGGPPPVSIQDARTAFNVCLAAYRSAQEQRPVRIG